MQAVKEGSDLVAVTEIFFFLTWRASWRGEKRAYSVFGGRYFWVSWLQRGKNENWRKEDSLS